MIDGCEFVTLEGAKISWELQLG